MEGARRLGLVAVYGDTGCLWIRAADGMPPSQIFLGSPHGIQGGALLWHPIQGIHGGHVGQPYVYHHFKYGGGRGNMPLGYSGVRVGRGARGVWASDEESSRALLCRRWYSRLPWPSRLQDPLDVLTVLLNRVGLQNNMGKTVGMVCQSCRTAGSQSEESYTRRIMREGLNYQTRQQERVWCQDCEADLV